MRERLKALRKEKNMNQDDLAEILKVTKNYICQIETGKKIPSDRLIKDVCREFNVSEEWLRYGIGPKEADKAESRFSSLARQLDLSKEDCDVQTKDMAADLMEIWIGLDSAHKKILLEVAEKIKEQIKKD